MHNTYVHFYLLASINIYITSCDPRTPVATMQSMMPAPEDYEDYEINVCHHLQLRCRVCLKLASLGH